MVVQLIFLRGGGIEGIHTDAIDLASLGRVSSRRASDVFWSEDLQAWTIHLREPFASAAIARGEDHRRGPYRNRQQAIDDEVAWLQELIRDLHE
jgi:hypothetical protein